MDSDDEEPVRKKQRRTKWVLQDEYKLLDIWEIYGTELRTKRNAHVYEKIRKEMGGKYSCAEIHNKIGNMGKRYRYEKREGCRSNWVHYDTVQQIIESITANDHTTEESFACKEDSNSSISSSQSDPLLQRISPMNQRVAPTNAGCQRVELSTKKENIASTPLPFDKSKSDHSKEVVQNLKVIIKQGEEQLKILRGLAKDTRHLYENLGNYLQEQQQNEQIFMKIFKTLVEKD